MASGGSMTYWTILVWSPALGISPQNMTMPFGGAALYVLSLDMMESMAPWTFFIVDLDLMFEDWEYSSLRYAMTSEICLVAGT